MRKNIIITGGELFNKGAQAMTFITISELKKRFPEHEIFVLSPMDLTRSREELEQYAFDFIGWYPMKFANAQSNMFLHILCKLRNRAEYNQALSIYKNCDLMIDISGYALGANWSYGVCNTFLENIEYAKAFNIPLYLMPQSFGPFNFSGEHAKELERRIKKLLPYPRKICVREQEGLKNLEKYDLKNIQIGEDIVLNNKEISLNNIYKKIPVFKQPVINKNSVGIIPNIRILDNITLDSLLVFYNNIIRYLKKQGKTVYLISHCNSDIMICEKIKEMFSGDTSIVYLMGDFSCIEFNDIVKQFDFIIGSRFHSLVHALKNGIPCISLGWAVKYYELMNSFGQSQYSYDVRNGIDIATFTDAIETLNTNRANESRTITDHLQIVQKRNVFDIITTSI